MCIRDRRMTWRKLAKRHRDTPAFAVIAYGKLGGKELGYACLLYTSDAADERSSVDLGGRRIIKKKKQLGNEWWCVKPLVRMQ